MDHPKGSDETGDFLLCFDRRVQLELHGSKVSFYRGFLFFATKPLTPQLMRFDCLQPPQAALNSTAAIHPAC
jgi:hypothetical protein